jgi:ribulose-5-phosphate 4-epimerase/fuculose-1-phosphate aldolase
MLPFISPLRTFLLPVINVLPLSANSLEQQSYGLDQQEPVFDHKVQSTIQNHGATTWGENLARAYTRSVYLEWLCRLYYQARLIGEPHLLSAQEISAVGDLLRTYGQRDAD